MTKKTGIALDVTAKKLLSDLYKGGEGLTQKQIADELSKEGFTTKFGKRLTQSSVSQVMREAGIKTKQTGKRTRGPNAGRKARRKALRGVGFAEVMEIVTSNLREDLKMRFIRNIVG